VGFVGAQNVLDLDEPVMGSEDFCYMLQACPGSLFLLGTKSTPGTIRSLHHPEYDFNDEILPVGAGLWVRLAEAWLPAGPTRSE